MRHYNMLWIDLSTFLQLSLIQFVINKYYNFLLPIKSLVRKDILCIKKCLWVDCVIYIFLPNHNVPGLTSGEVQ